MHLVEVLERCRQLAHHSNGIAEVHAAEVVTPKRIDEALGHAVALRAAYRCIDGFESEGSSHLSRLGGNVSAAVVTQELQRVPARH